jgi:hypothetical protein
LRSTRPNLDWWLGLLLTLEERPSPGATAARKQAFTWTRDDVQNPYIASALTMLDPGLSAMKQSLTEQTVDRNGNTVVIKQYNYGTGSAPEATPSRTYVNTYLTGTNYTSRYIYNRLVSTTMNGVTLVTNTYDGTGVVNVTGLREHDTANYGTAFNYRGNASQTVSMGKTVNRGFDITGTVTSSNDGQGHTASASMTSNNAVPSQITSNGLSSSFQYNSFLGVTGATGANTETAAFGYDPATSRPSTTTSPHGATTNFVYDDTTTPYKQATTNGKWVKTWMDGLGRTVKVETGFTGATNAQISVVDTEYGSCACSPVGKVKKVWQPYAKSGSPGAFTENFYDGLGRTLSVAHPGGTGTTTYSYSGNTTTVTDPAGKWKTYVSDAFGNLTQVVEPDPASPPFTPIRVNVGGSAYTDPSGNVWAARQRLFTYWKHHQHHGGDRQYHLRSAVPGQPRLESRGDGAVSVYRAERAVQRDAEMGGVLQRRLAAHLQRHDQRHAGKVPDMVIPGDNLVTVEIGCGVSQANVVVPVER